MLAASLILLLSLVVLGITYSVVTWDLTRKNKLWGVISLVVFPLVYVHAVTRYAGRRALVAGLLYLSTMGTVWGIWVSYSYFALQVAGFISGARAELSLECEFANRARIQDGVAVFCVNCRSPGALPLASQLARVFSASTPFDEVGARAALIQVKGPGEATTCVRVDNFSEMSGTLESDCGF